MFSHVGILVDSIKQAKKCLFYL